MQANFFSIYQQLYEKVKVSRDYGVLSKLLSNFSQAPDIIKEKDTLFLPSGKERLKGEAAILKMVFNLKSYDLTAINQLFDRLKKLEQLILPTGEHLKVKDISWGSITITISYGVVALLAIVYYLYKGASLFLDFETKRLGLKKLKQELQEKEEQQKQKEADKQIRALEKQKLELEIQQLQRAAYKAIQQDYNYQPAEYLPPANHEAALELGEMIQEDAEGIELYLEILEEAVKEA